MKKYLFPFLIMIAGTVVISLIRRYFSFSGIGTLLTVLTIVLEFVFGASLNDHRTTKGDTWIKKMLVMMLAVAVVLYYMHVIRIPAVDHALGLIGFTDTAFCLLFIWLGYLFFC